MIVAVVLVAIAASYRACDRRHCVECWRAFGIWPGAHCLKCYLAWRRAKATLRDRHR
jgi:hypothetical protein